MTWIIRLFIKNYKTKSEIMATVNIGKWERLLNWAMTVGVALWQAIQYIITNHPVK